MYITKAITTFFGLSAVTFISIDASPAPPSNINYNVINVLNDTYTMGVVVDNVTYPLTLSKDADILYTGSAPAAHSGYSYAQINKATNATEIEPFLRKPIETNTFNEFFNRTWNQYQVATLPNIYEPVKEINRVKTNLHREGEIATIHITANQTEFDRLIKSNITDDYEFKTTKLSYINLNETFSFKHAKISLSGHSSRSMPKVSFNLKLKKKDRLYQFRRIKLRAMITDPSYLREQLSYDVIKSVGLLSSEYSYCRLFINGRPLGLYGIMEPFQDPWLANSFADGDEDYENGYLYQGLVGYGPLPDLQYYENKTMYTLGEYKVKVPTPDGTKKDFQPLIDFTKAIAETPTNGSDVVESWNKIMNMDVFLRNMAVEILMGFSDGFISGVNNFYFYKNPSTNNMFYIPADFDLNMGNTVKDIPSMLTGNYSTFPNMNTSYLMNKLLQVPEFKQTFESYILNITQNLVNPTVMNNRINDLSNMLKEDIAWDQDLAYVGYDFSSMSALIGMNFSGPGVHFPLDHKPDNISAIESALLKIFKNPRIVDFSLRTLYRVPFEAAVNGPTGHISLISVKEWFQKINENVLNYFHK